MSKDEKPKDDQVCPHCGYCKACGRAHDTERVVYVPVPNPVPAQPTFTPVTPYQPYQWPYTPPGWPKVICGGSIGVGDYPPGEGNWTVHQTNTDAFASGRVRLVQ